MRKKTFATALKHAVIGSLRDFERGHPGEILAGYALLMDDDASSIGYACCSQEFLQATADPDGCRFEPVDWGYNESLELFREVQELLTRRYEEGSDSHIQSTFESMVSVLESLREEHFAVTVFLTVTCPDPSDLLEDLSDLATQRLNEPGLADAFFSWASQYD